MKLENNFKREIGKLRQRFGLVALAKLSPALVSRLSHSAVKLFRSCPQPKCTCYASVGFVGETFDVAFAFGVALALGFAALSLARTKALPSSNLSRANVVNFSTCKDRNDNRACMV